LTQCRFFSAGDQQASNVKTQNSKLKSDKGVSVTTEKPACYLLNILASKDTPSPRAATCRHTNKAVRLSEKYGKLFTSSMETIHKIYNIKRKQKTLLSNNYILSAKEASPHIQRRYPQHRKQTPKKKSNMELTRRSS